MKHQKSINNEQPSRKSKAAPAYSLSRRFPASLQLLSEGAALPASCTLDWRRGAFYLLTLISDSSLFCLPLSIHPQATTFSVKNTFCPQPGNQHPEGMEPRGRGESQSRHQGLMGAQSHPGCLSVPRSSEWAEVWGQAPVSLWHAPPSTPSFPGCALTRVMLLARAPFLPQGAGGPEPSPIFFHAPFATVWSPLPMAG